MQWSVHKDGRVLRELATAGTGASKLLEAAANVDQAQKTSAPHAVLDEGAVTDFYRFG